VPSFDLGFGPSTFGGPLFNLGNFVPQPPAVVNLVVPDSSPGFTQGSAGALGGSASTASETSFSPPVGGIITPPKLPGFDFSFPPGGFSPGPGWPIRLPPTPIPPILFVNDAYFSTPVGQTLTVDASSGLLGDAFDPTGGTLQITAVNGSASNVGTSVTLASGATLTVNADGSFTYVPTATFQGKDKFSFTASDGTASASATAIIDVMPPFLYVNDAFFTTSVGQTLTVDAPDGLLASAYDSSGNTVQVTAVNGSAANVGTPITLSSGATLTVNADGSLTYVPTASFQGDDSFTFTASDGVASADANATISVLAPVLSVGDAYYTTSTGQTLSVDAPNGLLANAYDSSGNTLQITAVNGNSTNVGTAITMASGATLTVNADGSFTYVPAASFQGDDSFTFTTSDGTIATDATATISVLAPYLFVSDAYYTTATGQTFTVAAADGLVANAYASSGNTVQIAAVNGAAANVGTPIMLPSGATLTANADGSFAYVPIAGFHGNDSFKFTVSDGITSADATATINVQAPFLFVKDAYYSTPVGQTLSVTAPGLVTDVCDESAGPAAVRIAAVNGSAANVGTPITLASGATLTVNADGSFTYLPAAGFQGSDSFTFTVSDGAATASATAHIGVAAPALYLPDRFYFDASTQPLKVDSANGLLAQAKDPTGGTLQITAINGSAANVGTAITLGSGATLTVNADGSFTYVPGANSQPPIVLPGAPWIMPPIKLGGDTFTFTASDGTLTATATAAIGSINILPPFPIPPEPPIPIEPWPPIYGSGGSGNGGSGTPMDISFDGLGS
jgi:hypothetical protein